MPDLARDETCAAQDFTLASSAPVVTVNFQGQWINISVARTTGRFGPLHHAFQDLKKLPGGLLSFDEMILATMKPCVALIFA
jgi:hypothetical protein